MIVEGRAASDASKLSTTLLDDLTKSKSRAKFRVSRRFGGGEGLAGFASMGRRMGRRSGPSCRDEASFEGSRDVGGKKHEDPGRKGTFPYFEIVASPIIAAKRMSSIHLLDNILFYPDYSAKFTCRMNYVVQVLLVKFRSKYQSNQPSFEFLDSMYIEVTTGL